jgi:gas vesicle structural protein
MNASTPEQESLMPTDTVPTDTRMRAGLASTPRLMLADSRQPSICEVLDRVLNKGAVIDGEATISVAGIDLVYLGLKLILTSIETARRESQFGAAEFFPATRIAEEKVDWRRLK